MDLVRPGRLARGDTVGIISPSSPTAAWVPRRFERGIQTLEDMGYSVKVGKNAKKVRGHKAGTIAERIEDLHSDGSPFEIEVLEL